MTNPKDILSTLHLVRSGLASGLLTKEEVIDWADKVITKDEQPDIFFIDLALSSSKSKNDIIHYFSDYLNFENPIIQGRPLLGLLYRQYKTGQINLNQSISKLSRLKNEAIFTDKEESYINSIDYYYELAEDKIYGTLEDVEIELNKFLSFYKDYSIDSFEKWQELELTVENEIDKDIEMQQERDRVLQTAIVAEEKHWWKFW